MNAHLEEDTATVTGERHVERTGTRAPQYALTAVRGLVGVAFVLSGLPKLGTPDAAVAAFDRWGLPAPELFIPGLGVVEIVAGVLLVLGVVTRYAALLLAATMVGAILTAGLVEGGLHLVVPPILGLLCLLVAVVGGGAWQLGRRRAG